MKRTLVLLTVSGIVALVVTGLGFWLLRGAGITSIHAYLALSLGVLLTAAIGGGLMALAFHSSRQGYDDEDRLP